MRRYFQILGLIVLALYAGGWGYAVAAVLCPHASSIAFKTGAVEDAAATKPHCHETEGETQVALPVASRYSNAFELPQNAPCTHCLSRPEAPSSTVVMRQQSEQKRSFEAATPQAATPASPAPSFAQPVLYRQGAPPVSSKPKHLLIGLLLI